jgi:hypothetical protein
LILSIYVDVQGLQDRLQSTTIDLFHLLNGAVFTPFAYRSESGFCGSYRKTLGTPNQTLGGVPISKTGASGATGATATSPQEM